MSGARLQAGVWVAAHIRRCHAAGRPAFLRRRGEKYGGSVLIKIDRLDGRATVLSPSFGLDGGRLWLRATGAEPVRDEQAEAYIEKRLKSDPDLWVIEIESADGEVLLDEPVE